MLVYRVEHKDSKKGPYTHYFTEPEPYNKLELCNIVHNYLFDSHHVEPKMNDGSSFNLFGWNFGFNTPKSLIRWFDNPRLVSKLQGFGFVVRIYESNQVMELNRQVAFVKEKDECEAEYEFYKFCKEHNEYFP